MNKQLGNKHESFSIRKYSIGAASILVGSLFLGSGQASAAEINETNTLKRYLRNKRNQLKNNLIMKHQRKVLNNHKTKR